MLTVVRRAIQGVFGGAMIFLALQSYEQPLLAILLFVIGFIDLASLMSEF